MGDQAESSYAKEPRRSYCCNSLIASKQFVREEKKWRRTEGLCGANLVCSNCTSMVNVWRSGTSLRWDWESRAFPKGHKGWRLQTHKRTDPWFKENAQKKTSFSVMKPKLSESGLSVSPSLKQWHCITAVNVFVPASQSGLWYYIALKIGWWNVQMGWFIKWRAHCMLQASDSSVTPVSGCSNRCMSMKHLANI